MSMELAKTQSHEFECFEYNYSLTISGRMEKQESGTGTGTLKIETRVNWEALKPVPDARVEIKFNMASSVIIVLRNFQHSDRDTKDVLTA